MEGYYTLHVLVIVGIAFWFLGLYLVAKFS